MNPIDTYKQINVFAKENGMELAVEKPGESIYTMTILEKHQSSPKVCHGGVVASFMDAILGSAALSLAFTQMELVSTVEFKISYFKPVYLADVLTGKGTIDFAGKSLITCSGEIFNQKKELVAKGIGTFNRYPISKSHLASLIQPK